MLVKPNPGKYEALKEQAVQGRSLMADARIRFFRNPGAVFGLCLLGFVAVFAIFGGLIAQYERDFVNFSLIGANASKGVPSIETGYYFGTDSEGRDLYSRVVQGTRISLLVGIIGAGVAVVVGTLYGAIAGYVGGRTDDIMMRTVDILMAIPFMFVLILLLVIFGRSIGMLFLGIGLISWLDMARIARGQTLSIKNKEFVEAAVATGVAPFRIIVRHIVPNLAGIVIVYATLLVPNMILYESFISFLGLGVQEPTPAWGLMLKNAQEYIRSEPWIAIWPGVAITLAVFGFNLFGDALRDALDPRGRG